jgi:hypothetical protein
MIEKKNKLKKKERNYIYFYFIFIKIFGGQENEDGRAVNDLYILDLSNFFFFFEIRKYLKKI